MSYQVLARKWRPQQFRDMIGQEHVLKALTNALDTDRLHHAYLFTGMRGVGKTTIARIFAKCLNCERAEHITAEPCGECPTCKDIEAGRFFDLIEVDAASRTKVEETRELLENVPYAPTAGRYKVYLIDEVHMFSTHSFNALLKTLEEPPSHVKFLLATTDPQKVPVTVLSRCLQFNLKRMVPAHLADYLATILDEESISHERGALDLIARAADGSVRDALSLVEQSAAYGEGAVKVVEVESMLGRVSVARLLDLLDALAIKDVNLLFERINGLAQYAPDFHQLLGELLSLIHKIALLQTVPNSIEPEATEADQLKELAEKISVEDIQLWYQIGMHARRDMPFAPDPREAFDMAMLRMLAFAPQSDNAPNGFEQTPRSNPVTSAQSSADVSATDTAIKPSASAQSPAPPVVTASKTAPAPATAPVTAIPPAAEMETNDAAPSLASSGDRMALVNAALGRTTKKKHDDVDAPVAIVATRSVDEPVKRAPEPLIDTAPEPAPDTAPHTAPEAAPMAALNSEAAIATHSNEPVLPLTNEHWPTILRRTDLAGLALQLAMNCAIDSHQNGVLALLLPKTVEHLTKSASNASLAKAISEYFGEPIKVIVESTNDVLVTPTLLVEQAAREAQQNAEFSIQNDPLLAELLNRVDGEVTKNSVRPVVGPTEDIATNGENS